MPSTRSGAWATNWPAITPPMECATTVNRSGATEEQQRRSHPNNLVGTTDYFLSMPFSPSADPHLTHRRLAPEVG
ncbi:hypothetical protein GCM10009789_14110 [Kribbella sancticallisti]|uniref:Uncharacterized protein n=1 Tax=Kribbella sancticallisti TaxID=460087 RepID=A0ABP4NHY3_9ACTN